MNDEKVLEALLAIETTVNGPDFSAWRKKFVDEHVDKFSYDDENKLEYTEIHQSYEAQIEEHIARGLPKEIPMADFMAALPDYIQGPGGQKEETSRAVTLLLEVSDFTAFKEMMLFCKKQKEDAAEGPKDTAGAVGTDSTIVFDVDGLMDMCAKLSESNASQEGWECVLKKDNIVIEKKALAADERTSKGQIYMRGVVTMDMTYTELVDCFCYFGERRKLWDSNYKGHELPPP